ncbi:MAG: SCO family protein [Vicinamibacterales bacterium]
MRALAVAVVLAGVVVSAACQRAPAGPPVYGEVGGDFTLTDQDGQPFDSASLRGNVVLVFFGYTFCPDVCPTTLSKIAAVTRALGSDATRVKTMYVSVDPKRDTPAVLKEHLGMFGVDAVGLTGTEPQIAAVARQYGAAYIVEESDSAAGYLVSHTTTLYALDPEGRTRYLFPYEASVDEIVRGIRSLL